MFLVGKDILYGLKLDSYIKREGSNVTISIPTDDGGAESFTFDEFPIESIEKKNILFKKVSVTISDNKTTCVHSDKPEPGTIYALLRIANCIPDDVFINKKHSKNFELIKKISYTTCEPDWGSYTANVYFVKITLAPDELVHVYFANKHAGFLKDHFCFYCYDDMEIIFKEDLTTFLLNDNEFMSLSELVSKN